MESGERGPVLEPLNPAETEWVETNLAAVVEAGVDLDDAASVSELFDVELQGWLSDPDDERDDPNVAVTVVGLAAGEHLRRRCGMDWALATDEQGSEIVVHRQRHDALVYPLDLVAQRWSDRALGTLGAALADVAARLDALSD